MEVKKIMHPFQRGDKLPFFLFFFFKFQKEGAVGRKDIKQTVINVHKKIALISTEEHFKIMVARTCLLIDCFIIIHEPTNALLKLLQLLKKVKS